VSGGDYTDEELERIERRVCLYRKCDNSLGGSSIRRLYCTEKHRKARHRELLRRELEAAGLPSSLSMKTARASGTTNERPRDGHTRPAAPQKRSPRPGLSVYFPTVADAESAAHALHGLGVGEPIVRALDRRRRKAKA
jgi:hypothetical protein